MAHRRLVHKHMVPLHKGERLRLRNQRAPRAEPQLERHTQTPPFRPLVYQKFLVHIRLKLAKYFSPPGTQPLHGNPRKSTETPVLPDSSNKNPCEASPSPPCALRIVFIPNKNCFLAGCSLPKSCLTLQSLPVRSRPRVFSPASHYTLFSQARRRLPVCTKEDKASEAIRHRPARAQYCEAGVLDMVRRSVSAVQAVQEAGKQFSALVPRWALRDGGALARKRQRGILLNGRGRTDWNSVRFHVRQPWTQMAFQKY